MIEQGTTVAILDGESIRRAEGWRVAGTVRGNLELPPYTVAKTG